MSSKKKIIKENQQYLQLSIPEAVPVKKLPDQEDKDRGFIEIQIL